MDKITEQITFLTDYYDMSVKRNKNAVNTFLEKVDKLTTLGEINDDVNVCIKSMIYLARHMSEDELLDSISAFKEIAKHVNVHNISSGNQCNIISEQHGDGCSGSYTSYVCKNAKCNNHTCPLKHGVRR